MAEEERGGELPSVDPRSEIESLREEVLRLRARVRELEHERAALLAEAARRDYERPPHYQ